MRTNPITTSGPDRKEQEIWLVITLGDTLGLSLADEEPGTVLRVDGTVYLSAASTIQAFFDRLIDSRGILVGIRVAPIHKEGDHAFTGLRPRAYLRRSRDEHWIDVFFAASTSVVPFLFGFSPEKFVAPSLVTSRQSFG